MLSSLKHYTTYISHVISIFYSWLPHTNSTHNVEIESQTLTLPCTSPLPAISLLTSVSNTVTGSSSNMHGSQQLRITPETDVLQPFTNETSQLETDVLPPLQVELSEQSFNTPHNDIKPNQLGLQSQTHLKQTPQKQPSPTMITQSQTHQKQPPKTQPLPFMITRSQRGIIKPNPKYALTSTTNSTNIPREPHNI